MELVRDGRLLFRDGSTVAGVYIYDDPLKCFLHDLRTPAGYVVSATTPQDHRHHKGLMFALKSTEATWWEERNPAVNGILGRQRHVGFENIDVQGERIGFVQHLAWDDPSVGEPHLLETRRISCRRSGAAHVWEWSTLLKPCRDMRFVLSPHAFKHEDGRRTSYHGLGVRLRRDFGGAGTRRVLVDGQPLSRVVDGMGLLPQTVTFEGTLDPEYPRWPGPVVSIGFTQMTRRGGLFVTDTLFGAMSVGPSNTEEFTLASGQELALQYEVAIADVQP